MSSKDKSFDFIQHKSYDTTLSKRGFSILKKEFTEPQLELFRKELIFTPFIKDDYGKKPEPFPVYLESPSKLYLPKHCGFQLFGQPKHIKLPPGDDIDIPFSGTPRDYQEPIISAFLETCKDGPLTSFSKGGLISVGCAAGKTVMSLYIASVLKKKTLVIVHKDFLMNQWEERIKQFLPTARIGRIQGPKCEIENKDIVLGMLQSISMKTYPDGTFDSFGFSIVDECFPPETLILTSNGPIPIFDIFKSFNELGSLPFKVISFNTRNNSFELGNISNALIKPVNEIIQITFGHSGSYTEFNKINTTINHPFLTSSGFIPAGKLNIMDKIIFYFKGFPTPFSILSIQYISLSSYQYFYDLTVDVFHNFIVSIHPDGGPIVHNCHHIAAETFSQALPKINSTYSLGLSATPNRADRCEKIFYQFLGPMVYQSNDKLSQKKVHVHVINYHNLDPEYSKEEYIAFGKVCMAKMLNNITNYYRRNFIILHFLKELHSKGYNTLVLSDRREHLAFLFSEIQKFSSVGYYVGGMKKKDLEASEKCRIILATYQMSSEGMDIPALNACIFGTPKSSIEQSIGRIVRKVHDLKPIAIDIQDEFSTFQYGLKKEKLLIAN